jgi:hypothetical protein
MGEVTKITIELAELVNSTFHWWFSNHANKAFDVSVEIAPGGRRVIWLKGENGIVHAALYEEDHRMILVRSSADPQHSVKQFSQEDYHNIMEDVLDRPARQAKNKSITTFFNILIGGLIGFGLAYLWFTRN